MDSRLRTAVKIAGTVLLAAALTVGLAAHEDITLRGDIRPPMGQPPEGIRPPMAEKHQDLVNQAHQSPGMGQEKMASGGGPAGSTISVAEANTIEAAITEEVNPSGLVGTYVINDTGTVRFYNDRQTISSPEVGENYYGQDATYTTNVMSFTANSDGTVTDNNTGLVWMQPAEDKMTWEEAVAYGEGISGWRLPTIKELYSLIDFAGNTVDTPYIDTDYFEFHWGDETGERQIDSQYATSTIYDTDTMDGNATMFGVNFADGRIKGYPTSKSFYVMLVQEGGSYGINNFVNNGDGTVTDLATGLMWMTLDSGSLLGEDGFMDWEEALTWAEGLDYAGYSDWKLPDAKELQSIVDYNRTPETTASAAIDPVFESTVIKNMDGETDFGYYWTSTTHAENDHGDKAVYVIFGRGTGAMNGIYMDVHGAGAQRSDPKSGDESDYPEVGNGPQGDEQRVYNLVRLVREAE